MTANEFLVNIVKSFPGLVNDSTEVNGADLVEYISQGIPQLKPATIRKLLDVIAIEKKQVDNLDLNRYGKPADWRK